MGEVSVGDYSVKFVRADGSTVSVPVRWAGTEEQLRKNAIQLLVMMGFLVEEDPVVTKRCGCEEIASLISVERSPGNTLMNGCENGGNCTESDAPCLRRAHLR